VHAADARRGGQRRRAVDIVHARGLKENYARTLEDSDTLNFIVTREIFKHLERVADAFEDVANQIDGIVVDHA
jgi:uncharacterized protein Yka (UPF0111/DUF47 family)